MLKRSVLRMNSKGLAALAGSMAPAAKPKTEQKMRALTPRTTSAVDRLAPQLG
jgi:hypothetical protein